MNVLKLLILSIFISNIVLSQSNFKNKLDSGDIARVLIDMSEYNVNLLKIYSNYNFTQIYITKEKVKEEVLTSLGAWVKYTSGSLEEVTDNPDLTIKVRNLQSPNQSGGLATLTPLGGALNNNTVYLEIVNDIKTIYHNFNRYDMSGNILSTNKIQGWVIDGIWTARNSDSFYFGLRGAISHEMGHVMGFGHSTPDGEGVMTDGYAGPITPIGQLISGSNFSDFKMKSLSNLEIEKLYNDFGYKRPVNSKIIYTKFDNNLIASSHYISSKVYNGENLVIPNQPNNQSFKLPGNAQIKVVPSLVNNGQISNALNFKHQNWENNLLNFRLGHKILTPDGGNVQFNGYFYETNSAFVHLKVDGADVKTAGIQFKDPWKAVGDTTRPDQWDSYSTPFTPGTGNYTTYGGLFRGVAFEEDKPNNAHYRVKADAQKSVGTVSGQFVNWSASGAQIYSPNDVESPVKFDQANATVSANYSARLASRYPDWVSGKKFASAENIDGLLYEKKWKNGASEERELWLHIEANGGKEIKIAGQSDNFRAYSVVKNQSYYAVLYVNGSNQLNFKLYNSTGVLSRNETLNTIGSTVVPHLLTEVMSYPNCPPYVDPDECGYFTHNKNIGIVWKEGTTIKLITLILLNHAGNSWISVPEQSWSSYLNSATTLQVATGNNMGTGSWIYYVYNGNVYATPFKSGNIYFPSIIYSGGGSPFTSVSGAVGEFGKLHLLISRNIPNYAYQIGLGTRDYNGNSTPYNVREYTYTSVGSHAYTAGGLSVAGDQILAQPGKYMYYRNVYDKWYFNGTNWNATNWASPASEWTPKPMLNQFTEDFVTTTAEGEFHKLNASHQSPMSKSSGGMLADRDPNFNQYLTVVGLTKGDTLATYADILPQFVDSIRIDTLGTWHIVLHQMNEATSLKSSLDLMGQSWVSTDSIRTVYFQPDTANFIHFLLDPTGEKARKVAGSGSDTEDEEIAVPKNISISAFPNPFNPSTNFKFSLPEKEMVSLKVYNLLGQEVATLVNKELTGGEYQVPFHASHLSTGTYLYKLVVGDQVFSGKINLVK